MLFRIPSLVSIPFFKKFQFPRLDFYSAFGGARFVGIDVGSDAVKVVQLRKDRERAVLETYGELKTARYFERGAAGRFTGRSDREIVALLSDVMREANVTARRAVFGIPATSSFITVVRFPLLSRGEIEAAIPFEAKKYIPIPLAEVAVDWEVIEEDEEARRVSVLLVAVPHEEVAKFKRISSLAGIELEAVEVESFSLARSLAGSERGVVAIIHVGAVVTTITVVDRRQVRMSHNFGRGSQEITSALASGLGLTAERAETVKRDVGLSERPEDQEVVQAIAPLVDSMLTDLERAMANYNRTASRKVERIILAGGGASLAGLVDRTAKRFGLETTIGNPFARTVFPAFLQPVLRGIAPNFAMAVGLALRGITPL